MIGMSLEEYLRAGGTLGPALGSAGSGIPQPGTAEVMANLKKYPLGPENYFGGGVPPRAELAGGGAAPSNSFDMAQALARIRANPNESGYGSAYFDASGGEGGGTQYGSMPTSRTGGMYYQNGNWIWPQGDGTYAVYKGNNYKGRPDAAAPGTMMDLYGQDGQYIGQTPLTTDVGGDDAMKQFIIGGSIMAAPFALAAMGAGAAGAGAGAADMAAMYGIEPGLGAGMGESLMAGSGLTGTAGPSLTGGMSSSLAGSGYGFAPSALADVGGTFLTPAGYGSSALGLDAALANFGTAAGLGATLPGTPGSGTPPGGSTPPPVPPGGPGGNGGEGFLDKIMSNPSSLLGPAATLAGALAGGQGQEDKQTASTQLPEFLQQPVAGDLVPRTSGLLASQMPQAQQAGQQMMQTGNSLLARPIAGNGVGSVTLDAPTTSSNPYLASSLDDLQRRYNDMIGRGLQGARSGAVGVGGLGGTRQALLESDAITRGADNFAGQAANFMGAQYNQDANRAMSKYGIDTSFYDSQRRADLAGATTGAGLLSTGLDTQWQPLKAASGIYGQFSPYGNKTMSSESGGGALGLLGGALSGASFGRSMGWWGQPNGGVTPPNPFYQGW